MSEILGALSLLHGLGLSLPQLLALGAKYGPLLTQGVGIIKETITLAGAFKAAFSHDPMTAITNAADIKFGLRLPTKEEEEVEFRLRDGTDFVTGQGPSGA